jgi:hypothetical protein
MTPPRTNETEAAEVRTSMDAYLAAFQDLSVERTLPFYHVPCFALTPMHTEFLTTEDQARSFLAQTFAQLRAQGYQGSRWEAMNIFVLHPAAAVVSTIWARVDTSGKMIGRSATTYQLTRASGAWQIISAVLHDTVTLIH